MTRNARSLKPQAQRETAWRDLRSPPAANDTTLRLVALSRSLPKSKKEVALLRNTLDLNDAVDLRAAALLALLALGLRKKELVELDISDIVTVGAVVCVNVRSRRGKAGERPAFLPVIGDDARVLRQYLSQQHDEAAALTSPLFYGIEHGNLDRMRRMGSSAVSYWLLELRMRARRLQTKPRRRR